ncbi:uncharacterized protein YndB with AHSA1/START domain [Bacillus pakistanensis]|uniref:Uncharacterized protein YndB with AHSA1/START domain n=1 Tax=Rossellomorea pakistanensis TaxID=992288 RepID=A0ABS2NDM9_9BACI|nr:SRPBCC domain-containing protein [Bacillus pakistanensis]MBM7585924.1 uncharacterized protein YndB with AHSA1/START domain [Bacillus pakistanensis]
MDIRKEIIINAELSLVWKAWTESERIIKWFAPAAEIDPRENGKFELYFSPDNKDMMSTKGCRILQYKEPTLLEFEWKGPDPFAGVMNDENNLTTVSVEFESLNEMTKVTLIHQGWKDTEEYSHAREWHVQAWEQMLKSLKSNMESGEGILCCQ